jgi:PKD repeat protein
MTLKSDKAAINALQNDVETKSLALAAKMKSDMAHDVEHNDTATSWEVEHGELVTAIEALQLALLGMTYPTVSLEEVDYDIILPEVIWNGTLYTAEEIADDEELAAEMLEAGVKFIVQHVVADFTVEEVTGEHPAEIQFANESTGDITEYVWDFGDNTGGSNEQNPSYTYTIAGTYTVTLTVKNKYGSDEKVRTEYITIS